MTDKNKKRILTAICVCAMLTQSGCSLSSSKALEITKSPNANCYKDDATRTYINYDESATEYGKQETAILQDKDLSDVKLSYAAELFLSDLTEYERKVYKQICHGLQNFETTINISSNVIKQEDICAFIVLCTTTTPEINYIEQQYTVSIDEIGYVSAVKVSYTKTPEEYQAEQKKLNKKINTIISKISSEWDDYKTVKYFHDTIIKNCSYGETNAYSYTAYGALVEGDAVCEGYTKAMLMLCEKAGIGCIPVIGVGIDNDSTTPHIWNKIIIDNNWYNYDLTWDDPVTDMDKDYVRYDYFAITDDEIFRNHSADSNIYLNYPSAIATDNYYVRSDLFANDVETATQLLQNSVLKTMKAGGNYARIKLSDNDTYSQTYQKLFKEETDGTTEIFRILRDAVEISGYSDYSSQSYSEITNPEIYTITVKLNKN